MSDSTGLHRVVYRVYSLFRSFNRICFTTLPVEINPQLKPGFWVVKLVVKLGKAVKQMPYQDVVFLQDSRIRVSANVFFWLRW